MAKSRKRSNRPAGPPPRGRRLSSAGISSWYLWVIVGVLVLAGLFMLARTLSTAPPREVILPVLASSRINIEVLTGMVGDIELRPGLTAQLPEDLRVRFQPVDSLVGLNDWHEALERLRKLPRPAGGDAAAVIEEYVGFCLYRSVRPDHALSSFRRAANLDSSRDRDRQFRLAFAAGYLFQSYGFADSALESYLAARDFTPADSSDPLLPAYLNNLALAFEATGDTAAALPLYLDAAVLVDTTDDTPSARVIRDNLRRAGRQDRRKQPTE